jgi:hypothetical protein
MFQQLVAKRKLEQLSTSDNKIAKPDLRMHYVTFLVHDDMDFYANDARIDQKGPYLFSSRQKAERFVTYSLCKVLVGHFQFEEEPAQNRTDILHALSTGHFSKLGLYDLCQDMIENLFGKENDACGITWSIDLVPQVDQNTHVDLL